MAGDELENIVIAAARNLDLLDDHGELLKIDSLATIDLAMEIEDATQIRIPPQQLRPDLFSSVAAIAELLRELTRDSAL